MAPVNSLRVSARRSDCSRRPAFICSSTALLTCVKPSPSRSETCCRRSPLVRSRREAMSAAAEENCSVNAFCKASERSTRLLIPASWELPDLWCNITHKSSTTFRTIIRPRSNGRVATS